MPNTKPTILAINPGTRYIGIAVLKGQELLDWQVKVVNGKWSLAKLRKITALVDDLIAEHEPTAFVLKRLHPARRSPALEQMCAEILNLAKAHHLAVYEYSIKELEESLAPSLRANKQNLTETVCSRFPFLIRELRRERKHDNPYHIRMFEAVALAIVAESQDRERASQEVEHDSSQKAA